MKIAFACEVVAVARGDSDVRWPAIEIVRRANGAFPCKWNIDARLTPPLAVGYADVTTAQMAAIDADNRIIALSIAALDQRLNQLSANERQRVQNKLEALGVTTASGDNIREVFERAIARIQPGSLDDLAAGLNRDFGV